MKKLNTQLHLLFGFALLSSILFVAGIPMTVLGATNDLTPLLVTGIVLTAIDFYAIPLLWIAYAGKRGYRRLLFAILSENILTVRGLSTQLAIPEEEVRKMVRACVHQCYLVGYIFDGDRLTVNTNSNPQDRIFSVECESCGAKISFHPGETPVCPYCGSVPRTHSGR